MPVVNGYHINRSILRPFRVAFTALSLFYLLYTRFFASEAGKHTDHKFVKRDQSFGAVRNSTKLVRTSYDFIIVGGGQSGLTVANRLSASASRPSVLVIEYGYLYHDDPLIARPWQPFAPEKNLFHDPKLMYNFSSTPQQGLNGRQSEVSAASTVGGGSTVNGMFINRGSKEDYDAWEKLGNPGWGWKGLLPYFKKSATFTPPGEMLREDYNVTFDRDAGYGQEEGPIQLSYPEWAWPTQKVQMEGLNEMGFEQTQEGAGGDAVSMFWVPRAQDPKNQTRSYAVTGHLDPALERENFNLLPGHRVNQILLDSEDRAEGVLVSRRGGHGSSYIYAKKEVILAAGLHSPVILQQSGIGPKKLLDEAGVDVRVDLPGVGMNLQDHPTAGVAYSFRSDFNLNPGSINRFQAADEFRRTRSGPHVGGHNLALFLPSESFFKNGSELKPLIDQRNHSQYLPQIYENDTTLAAGYARQLTILAESYASNASSIVGTPLGGDPFALLILQKPLSRGTITLDPENPMFGDPLVDYGTYINPLDMDVIIAMIDFTRAWYNTTAMRTLTPIENSPGPAVTSYADLEQHVREHGENTIGHQSGTTAMMPRELGGVVDTKLRVYGVTGLSVVDASIMPLIPSTNLCGTVYAVAEKAADLIKKRHRLR